MGVVEGRVELVRPMDAAAIDDHHNLFSSCAEGRHHLMDILAQLLGIKMRDDLIKPMVLVAYKLFNEGRTVKTNGARFWVLYT